ncbi:hypothetical protein [Caulobacter sp. RL271]|uniref:Uncharacterized protein n=1 Tax=Caulobacter segnis TaxID=88688 RepID=A0ABY4ZQY8_9CAUL|nr:hypothetical protein [Caulobacter segnis]USQ95006.1 hypothetical protein MZV50_20960 [Caulobacter segnis]
MLTSLLLFFYIFIWPVILPLICIVAVARAARPVFAKVVTRLALVIAVTAVPLVFVIQTEADHDLPLASLMLYPIAVACLGLTALLRLMLIRMKRPKAQA